MERIFMVFVGIAVAGCGGTLELRDASILDAAPETANNICSGYIEVDACTAMGAAGCQWFWAGNCADGGTNPHDGSPFPLVVIEHDGCYQVRPYCNVAFPYSCPLPEQECRYILFANLGHNQGCDQSAGCVGPDGP